MTAAPTRASASFTITAGLLSIPCAVYTSTESVTIGRSQFLADGTSVGSAPCVKLGEGVYGDKVDKSQIVKRFQTTSGLVDLTDEEMDACSTAIPGHADVLAVHPLTFLRDGRYVPNGKVWQLRAGKLGSGKTAKPNPGGEKALALVLKALTLKEQFMLLRWSRDGSVYTSALLGSGRLVGLWHDEEIREERTLPFADHAFSGPEIAMAGQLLDAYAVSEPTEIHNDSVAAITAYAEEKAKTGVVVALPTATVAPTAEIDIMAQMQASIDAIKAQRGGAQPPVMSEPAATMTLVETPAPKKRAPRKKAAEKIPA